MPNAIGATSTAENKGAEENNFLFFIFYFLFFIIIIGEAIMANRYSTFTSKASFLIS